MNNSDLTMKTWDLTMTNWDLTIKHGEFHHHGMKLKKTSPQNNGDLFVWKSKKTWVKMLWFFKGLTPKLETFGDGK